MVVWQSSRPASFSPAGLTIWPSWLERWLATLSGLSVQVRIQVGLSVPGHYSCTGEAWNGNVITHFITDVITYPSWDVSYCAFVNGLCHYLNQCCLIANLTPQKWFSMEILSKWDIFLHQECIRKFCQQNYNHFRGPRFVYFNSVWNLSYLFFLTII